MNVPFEDYPAEISKLELPSEKDEVVFPDGFFNVSGNCQKYFSGKMGEVYALNKDRFSFGEIFNGTEMFAGYNGEELDVDLTFAHEASADYMFNASYFKKANVKLSGSIWSINNMFQSCSYLKEVVFDVEDATITNNSYLNAVYYFCYGLRKPDLRYIKRIGEFTSGSNGYSPYWNFVTYCSCMDEVVDIPVIDCPKIKEYSVINVSGLRRVKRFTFEVNDDGSPKKVKWSGVNLNTTEFGFGAYDAYLYNDDFTQEDIINNNADYERNKNNPNACPNSRAFSRYTLISAIETINTLPDTSEFLKETGYKNTIRFSSSSGASTDEGAIENLPNDIAALAISKGWTVEFGM
jgi:hypothetical protein